MSEDTKPKISRWYRTVAIRPDDYVGWEVVVKYIWCPFWIMPQVNTHLTIQDAEEWAYKYFSNLSHKIAKIL